MFATIIAQGQVFLLVMARVYAIFRISPIFSSGSLPRLVRVLLAFFCSSLLLPQILERGYPIPTVTGQYIALLIGEILIGVVIGFIILLVIAVFQLAGQLFSIPVGFGVAQAFDPLAQIEIPILGQFFNLIATFLFLTIGGLQRIFLYGVRESFYSFRANDLLFLRESLATLLIERLSQLFVHALIIALPIIGLLILIYLVIGLIAKAAPQMNLLILGFPFSVGIAFFIIFLSFPVLADIFRNHLMSIFTVLGRYFSIVRSSHVF